MAQDVLGYASKGTKNNPKAVTYSTGSQKNINSIQKNAGVLADSIGKGPDASYKKFQQQQLATKIVQQKQQQAQQDEQKRQQAKQDAQNKITYKATHNPVTNTAGNITKGFGSSVANTVKAPINLTKTAMAQATGNTKAADNAAAATKSSYDQSLAKFPGDLVTSVTNKASQQIKHLAGPGSSQAERNSIIKNQKTAAKNPEFNKATVGIKSGTVSGNIQAEKMAAQGKKAPEIHQTLVEQSKKSDANLRKGAATAVGLGSLVLGGAATKAGVASKDLLAESAKGATAGSVGSASSVVANDPNASKKDIGTAGIQGAIAGGLLPLGARVIGKTNPLPSKVAPEVTSSFNQVADQAKGRMSLGKTAVQGTDEHLQPLLAEKEKLTQLKNENSHHSAQIDPMIANADKKIAEVQKVGGKQSIDAQKLAEKNTAELKKIDQQTELIKAKKADSPEGKLSNVDQVKLKQLQDRKTELSTPIEQSPAAQPQVAGAPSPELQAIRETPVTPAKTSRVANSIEAKAIEQKLTNGFEGKAGFDPIVVKEQAKLGADLVNKNPERAMRMATGSESIPSNLRGATVLKALEEHASKRGDANMLREIARSPLTAETSRHAQELRLLAEREPDSAVTKMRELAATKKAAFEKKAKTTLAKATTKTAGEIKAKVKAPSRMDWNMFMDEIRCK